MMSVDSCQTVVCIDCKCTESSFWHKSNGNALCTTCYCRRDGLNRSTRSQGLVTSGSMTASKVVDDTRSLDNSGLAIKSGSANITRKSNRLKPLTKNKPGQSVVKTWSTKGRSKRFIFKKNVSISLQFFLFLH